MKEFLKNMGKTEIRNLLGVIITVGVFVMLYLLMVKPIPPGNESTINQAVGFVSALSLAVAGFFYGASKKDGNEK